MGATQTQPSRFQPRFISPLWVSQGFSCYWFQQTNPPPPPCIPSKAVVLHQSAPAPLCSLRQFPTPLLLLLQHNPSSHTEGILTSRLLLLSCFIPTKAFSSSLSFIYRLNRYFCRFEFPLRTSLHSLYISFPYPPSLALPSSDWSLNISTPQSTSA